MNKLLILGVVGFSGLLASCDNNPKPPSDNLGEKPTISGKLSDYTKGKKVLKIVTGGAADSISVESELKADGSFSFELPTPKATDLTIFKISTCKTGEAKSSADDAKIGFSVGSVYESATDTKPTGFLKRLVVPLSITVGEKNTKVFHIYVSKDINITYTNCLLEFSGSTENTINGLMTLKTGWNIVFEESEITEVGTKAPISATKTKTTVGMGSAKLSWSLFADSGMF